MSRRDLAIACSYAGDLGRAAQYAHAALGHEAHDPAIVAGRRTRTLGGVAVRRGQLAEAIGFYTQAEQAASERFPPLIRISLANACASNRDATQARALYDRVAAPTGPLLPLYRHGHGNLRLIEGKPADALRAFESAAESARGSDASYHRLWALEGMARSLRALGDKAGARYVEAAQLARPPARTCSAAPPRRATTCCRSNGPGCGRSRT